MILFTLVMQLRKNGCLARVFDTGISAMLRSIQCDIAIAAALQGAWQLFRLLILSMGNVTRPLCMDDQVEPVFS